MCSGSPEASPRRRSNPRGTGGDDAFARIPLADRMSNDGVPSTRRVWITCYTPRERERCVIHPRRTKEGRRDVKPGTVRGATCVTSPRGSRDGLRYRNGKLRKLSRNATPEPPFSSAERATVDSADYTSGPDAAKRASQAEFLRGPASTTLWPGSLKLRFG